MGYLIRKLGHIPYTTSQVVERTGDWRIFKPVIKKELCKKCLICLDFCPDVAINETETSVEINYDYCKGCGICANECPFKAIEMVDEH